MGKFRLSGLSGGVLVSLALHGLIVAALLIDLPDPVMQAEPDEEQVVAVTLVPPPEPEVEPEAAPEPEIPEPEAEQSEPEPPAPPEPEPESEPADPEPEPEAPEPDAQPEPASPAAETGAVEEDRVPIPVLTPVFQFGEEDSGSEIAPDGGASEAPSEEASAQEQELPADEPALEEPLVEDVVETPPEPVAEPDSEAVEAAETAEVSEQDQQAADTPEDQPPADPVPTLAMPDDITQPDAELAGDIPGALAEAASETELASLPEDPAGAAIPVPQPRPANPAKPDTPAVTGVEPPAAPAPAPVPALDSGLPGVRQLSSSVNTGHAVATTAMGNMPRDARGSALCTTELREQLRRAPEPYQLELLPSYGLPGGNVLAIPNAAFRAGGAWYDLSFRCTVDNAALKVTGFTFKVGEPIPRAQWQARGFPAY